MKKECPIIKDKCQEETCIGFCSSLRKKLFKSIPSLKVCSICQAYLLPFGELYLHQPDSKCKYAEMMGVTIEITRDDYCKALGTPTETFQDLIHNLTLEPKSLLRRLLNAFKRRQDSLKQ